MKTILLKRGQATYMTTIVYVNCDETLQWWWSSLGHRLYMLEPIPLFDICKRKPHSLIHVRVNPISLFAIHTITSVWLNSHSLCCEIGFGAPVRSFVNHANFDISNTSILSKHVQEYELSHFATMCCCKPHSSLLFVYCQSDPLLAHNPSQSQRAVSSK